ncbi:hypothetical protein LC612_08815 [Nostoc sp. CHAB 5834]|nr:hypothetical protein [Nostoc sp. CHAB 5834]
MFSSLVRNTLKRAPIFFVTSVDIFSVFIYCYIVSFFPADLLTGKGRNVYYSKADLLVLTVMEQLLSIGLNFEVCHAALETLREQEPWLFNESLPEEKMKRLMLLTTRSPEKPLQLAEFDKQVALEALCQGQTVIPFWCDACGKLR